MMEAKTPVKCAEENSLLEMTEENMKESKKKR